MKTSTKNNEQTACFYERLISTALPMREWSPEDTPEYKLLNLGASALSNAELISVTLGSNEKTLEASKRLLAHCDNNLNRLGELSIKEIAGIEGITLKKAAVLYTAFELGKRRRSSDLLRRTQIRNSRDLYDLMHARLQDVTHEECWAIIMNNQHRVLLVTRISHGGVSETTVDPKIVLKIALEKLASSIVLVHNHPSGNPYPSSSDDKITQKIKQGCQYLDMQLTDHIIYSADTYYSYSDEGKL